MNEIPQRKRGFRSRPQMFEELACVQGLFCVFSDERLGI